MKEAEGIFISKKNLESQRFAVFEDDGLSGWLYLTEPNQTTPIADCWIYNRIPAPDPTEIKLYRDTPPPASSEYAGPNALLESPEESDFCFKWSNDGNSVALLYKEFPLGFIVLNPRNGFSRNLSKSGDWGKVFDQELYERTFGWRM